MLTVLTMSERWWEMSIGSVASRAKFSAFWRPVAWTSSGAIWTFVTRKPAAGWPVSVQPTGLATVIESAWIGILTTTSGGVSFIVLNVFLFASRMGTAAGLFRPGVLPSARRTWTTTWRPASGPFAHA